MASVEKALSFGILVVSLLGPWSALAQPAVKSVSNPVVFRGMCDASGAVVLGDSRFIVADDEDNVLRIYDGQRGGPPLSALDVSPALELPMKKKGAPEADLEAATGLAGHALWLASHGRNRKGEVDRSRMRFFATTAPGPDDATPLQMVGKPYKTLLDDLLDAPTLASFGLAEAAQRAPKEQGGLNIEGMTARPDGKSVLLGFRSPLVDGKAIVVPLENPLGLVKGERALFGKAVLLDLGGLGVRSLSTWRDQFLIVAGAVASGQPARLFTWDGKSPAAKAVPGVDLTAYNPEGVASFSNPDRLLLLSDDGSREIDGQPCKKLKDPTRKEFRGFWVDPPDGEKRPAKAAR